MFQNQSIGGQARPVGSPRTALENRVNSCRSALIVVVLFSFLNCLFRLIGSTSYFFFSAMVPYFFAYLGVFLTGGMPELEYQPAEVLPHPVLYIMGAMAMVLIAIYLVCFLLSKKFMLPAMLAATVCFALDTVGTFVLFDLSVSMTVNYVLHIFLLIWFVSGTVAAAKLKKLPPDELNVNPSAQPGPAALDEAASGEVTAADESDPFSDPIAPESTDPADETPTESDGE